MSFTRSQFFLAIGCTHPLEANLVFNNTRYLSNGCEKFISKIRIISDPPKFHRRLDNTYRK
jgi:hypothetical protein